MKTMKIFRIMGLSILLIIFVSLHIQAASKIEAEWIEVMAEKQAHLDEVPDDVIARFKLAVAYANLGYLEETMQEFELLKEKNSGSKADEMIRDYELLYQIDPDDLQVMNYLAFAYYVNDQYEESEIMFKQIVEADPENLWAHNYYALVQGNKGDYDSALLTLQNARKIEENKYTHFILSLVYYKKGNLFKSLYHLGKSGNVGVELLK